MLLTFDRETVVNVAISLQLIHERYPYFLAFVTIHESFCIRDENNTNMTRYFLFISATAPTSACDDMSWRGIACKTNEHVVPQCGAQVTCELMVIRR